MGMATAGCRPSNSIAANKIAPPPNATTPEITEAKNANSVSNRVRLVTEKTYSENDRAIARAYVTLAPKGAEGECKRRGGEPISHKQSAALARRQSHRELRPSMALAHQGQ